MAQPPEPTFSPSAVYMQGTRRAEEMIYNARQLAYQESYSYTEGWDDNTVVQVMNFGLDRLYDALTQIDSPPNINEYTTTTIAGVQIYPIPMEIKLALSIMDVRFLYGPQTWEFITLRQGMIQDRFGYPTNIPDTYCIRNGTIILSPTPNLTRANNLIINYQSRMRKLDIRRGKVSGILSPQGIITNISNTNPVQITTLSNHGRSTGQKVGLTNITQPLAVNEQSFFITVTGTNTFTLNGIDGTLFPPFIGPANWFLNPVQFQLNFTVTSQKDTNLQANCNSIMDKVDWACMCDRFGNPIIDAIPLNGYNMSSFVLTADQDYVIPGINLNLFNGLIENQDICYVLSGDFSSSHSQLDRQTEDHLIEYTVLRLYRLQSNAEPTVAQMQTEEAVLQRLRLAYRRYRPAVSPVVWQERLRPRSWPWGRRGLYSHHIVGAYLLFYILYNMLWT